MLFRSVKGDVQGIAIGIGIFVVCPSHPELLAAGVLEQNSSLCRCGGNRNLPRGKIETGCPVGVLFGAIRILEVVNAEVLRCRLVEVRIAPHDIHTSYLRSRALSVLRCRDCGRVADDNGGIVIGAGWPYLERSCRRLFLSAGEKEQGQEQNRFSHRVLLLVSSVCWL